VPRRRTVIVITVHVLLAALVLTAMAAWGPGDNPASAGQHVTVPDLDPRLPANPEALAIVRPPGLLVLDSTREKHGNSPAVLPPVEAQPLIEAGVVRLKAFVTRDGDLSRGVWQMAVRDSSDPRAALRAIDEVYAAGGWAPAPGPVRGVVVRQQTPAAGQPYAGFRAHYVRGPYLMRIEVYGTDAALVDREFAALARWQLDAWPPR
jgi:hypothetical protein